jgi:hypothetical protein
MPSPGEAVDETDAEVFMNGFDVRSFSPLWKRNKASSNELSETRKFSPIQLIILLNGIKRSSV